MSKNFDQTICDQLNAGGPIIKNLTKLEKLLTLAGDREFSAGCYLLTQEEMISDQASWDDEDEAKDMDFTAAPYWVTTNDGAIIPVHDNADMVDISGGSTITADGREYPESVAAELMDDDIREELHAKLAPCDPQDFFDAYCVAHAAKYGEEFVIN